MSFVDDTTSLRSKLHLHRFSPFEAVGAALVACALLVLAGSAFLQSAQGSSFFVDGASQSQGPSAQDGSGGLVGSSATGEAIGGPVGQDEDGGGALDESSNDAGMTDGARATRDASQEICVDVVGAVAAPGMYRLPAGSRIDDAIKAAGGFTPNAARSSVNLARSLSDGEQLLVLNSEEAAAQSNGNDEATAPGAQSSSAVGGGAQSAAATPGTDAGASGGKVNINTASASELMALKGVGEATAQKIVDYREGNGPFSKLTDLKKVSGIGEKKYEAIADDITL